jgi:hypothetical protein
MVSKIFAHQPRQDLKTVPFQVLHEKVTLAGRRAVESLTKNEVEAHRRFISRKEQEWVNTHESPYEGNFEEEYPFIPPDPNLIQEEKIKAEQKELVDCIKAFKLKEKAMWLLPQVTAYIAKMKLPRDKDGRVDSLEFLRANFTDEWHKGLYRYCTCFQRGLIVPNQYTETYKNYSALVPLLMMPFKKFDGVRYNSWKGAPGDETLVYNDPEDPIKHILDPQLYLAMIIDPLDLSDRKFTTDEILATRAQGLLYKTGEKAGTSRNSISSFRLYGIDDTELGVEPWLTQVMTTQIWMAHPTIRTNLMVLDGANWDNIPDPLIESEILKPSNKPKHDHYHMVIDNDLSWAA